MPERAEPSAADVALQAALHKVLGRWVRPGVVRQPRRLAARLVVEARAAGWLPPAEVQERIEREGHCCDRPGG